MTRELKEKLFKANSVEEIKVILGDQATEEEASKAWEELQKYRAKQAELEAVDDDELDAVSGGALWCLFGGEYAADGNEVGCIVSSYTDWSEAARFCCPNNEAGGWKHEFEFDKASYNDRNVLITKYKCKKCSYIKTQVGHNA